MAILRNFLKAVLYPENMVDGNKNVAKEQCYTVEHFAYGCSRKRNDAGFPYGATTPSELVFTIKLETPNSGKEFYQRIKENELFCYTFLFNAEFSAYGRLSSFDSALIAKGYMVDIEEYYNNEEGADHFTSQILIKATLLLSSITFKGLDCDKVLEITKY